MNKLFFLLLLTAVAVSNLKASNTEINPSVWSLSFSLGFSANSGNTDNSRLNTGLNLARNTPRTEFSTQGRVTYGESSGENDANWGKFSLTYDSYILSRVKAFLFCSDEYDKLAQIDVRLNSGTGLKYEFIRNKTSKVSLSGAILVEYEDSPLSGQRDSYRFSLRPKIQKFLTNDTVINFVAFYIPNLEHFEDDYRIDATTNLKVHLQKNIWLKVELLDRYNNLTPSDTIKNNDLSLTTSVEISF